MELKLSKYIKYSEPLNQDEGPSGKRIILSTRKSMGISVTNFVVDLVKKSNFTVLPNHLFNILMFHEIVIPDDQEETEEILKVKGIVGEDTAETCASLIVELNKLKKNELHIYLDNVIDKANLTSKVKTITVEMQGSLKDFFFNESNLVEIKTYIDAHKNSTKIKVEYKLTCGIPKDNLLINNDLSWIKNIKIIYIANEKTTDFINAMDRLKMFSENNKLKNKIITRIILPNNYIELITKSHEIIKSTRDSIFRFSLRKDGYEKLENWSKEELKLLKIIEEHAIHSVQFSEAAFNFLDESFNFKEGFHYEHFEDFILEINDEDIIRIDKNKLTSEKVKVLKEKSPKCYECMFISMCGGIINKNRNHNMDCPDIRSNIMVKSRMKYQI